MPDESSGPASDLTALSDASRLLRKELAGFRCLVCRNDEFVELDLIEQGLQSNVMLYEGDDPVAKKHAPLLTIACANCGHLEQFAAQPLLKRLKAESLLDERRTL